MQHLEEYAAWLRYLESPREVDEVEFCYLLNLPDVNVQEVFAPLPNGAALAAGVQDFMARTTQRGVYFFPNEAPAPREHLLALAQAQADEYATWLRAGGELELAAEVEAAEPQWLDDADEYEDLTDADELSDAFFVVGDEFIEAYIAADERYGGAHEMMLHLSMYSVVTDHLLTRAVPFGMTWQAGYDLYLAGGRMALLPDRIAVSYL